MNLAEPITLSPEERQTLDAWSSRRSLPFRVVQRARIIRMAADGVLNQDIAKNLHISRPTVQQWRQRFLSLRLPGLEKDAPRPGRKPRILQRKIDGLSPPHCTASRPMQPTGAREAWPRLKASVSLP